MTKTPSQLTVTAMGDDKGTGKGGFKAASFMYALIGLENMGFIANSASLVLYFSYKMYFDLPTSANTLTNLVGSICLLSFVGGFVSDTYLNKFLVCIIFGAFEVSALAMMTIQARTESLLPEPCGKSSCVKGGKAVYFYATLCFLALGAGGLKGSLPPFGADQFDAKNPKKAKALGSYFNYYWLCAVVGATVGVTVIVWVATNNPNNQNWWKGFLISTVATTIGYMVFLLGKPFYRLVDRDGSRDNSLKRFVQVIVVALKNARLSHPDPSELHEINGENQLEKLTHTKEFRWLDKAAILPNNIEPAPWNVCTVTQVEEVKAIARILPIIASTIVLNTCMAQLQTFSIQQAYRMDRHLGSFKVPAPSIPVIPLLFLVVLIPLYDRIFVPMARRITHLPSGITQVQRIGVGLIFSVISMAISALIELKRRNHSLKNPLEPISLFWLSFQFAVLGIADLFTIVGLLEFTYSEAPAGMKSLSTSFSWISQSFGYFLSSVFVNVINSVTKRITPSRHGWLHGQDLDKNRLDLFYWFLSIFSLLNFFNYLFWAKRYKFKTSGGQHSFNAVAALNLPTGVDAAEDDNSMTMYH